MKKYLALLLALVMTFALFAGCTPAETTEDPADTLGGAVASTGVIDTERE